MIALSVIFHIIGLGIFNAKLLDTVRPTENQRHLLLSFGVVMGVTTLMAPFLHAIEAANLGSSLPAARRTARHKIGDALAQ